MPRALQTICYPKQWNILLCLNRAVPESPLICRSVLLRGHAHICGAADSGAVDENCR